MHTENIKIWWIVRFWGHLHLCLRCKNTTHAEKDSPRFIDPPKRLPFEVREQSYTFVKSRLDKRESHGSKEKIVVHSNCGTNFRTRVAIFQSRHGLWPAEPASASEVLGTDTENTHSSPVKHTTRLKFENVRSLEKKCFVCKVKRAIDGNAYNEGGLQRCTRDDTASKLLARRNAFLYEKANRYYVAAKRLDILLSGGAHDIFAADIFYHQSCYIKFVVKTYVPVSNEETERSKRDDVLELFMYKVKVKIVRDKEAYLLHELLNDVKCLSAEQELDVPAIEHTSTLKVYLSKMFPESIAFFPSSKYLLVHPIDINPCTYSVATLHGFGLRDADLTKAFGKMIRRKLEELKSSGETWPLTPDELLAKLDTGPLPELYNSIYFSIHERGELNQYGYAITSHTKAAKIWSLASDWESIITKQRTPKQIILGMVLHRNTLFLSKYDFSFLF